MAEEIGLDDSLAPYILNWVNSTDFDLEPTCTVIEEVTIPPPELLQAILCNALVENESMYSNESNPKNVCLADLSSSSSGKFKTSSDSKLKHLIDLMKIGKPSILPRPGLGGLTSGRCTGN